MKFKASGHYLIVKLEPVESEQVSEGGIIINTLAKDKNREQAAMALADVVNVGQNCWGGFYDKEGDAHSWCAEGDRVMIAKHAGQGFPISPDLPKEEQDDLALYRLIKDDDVLAVEGDRVQLEIKEMKARLLAEETNE